ncbi:MAG: M48 family metalloprotease [Okeania sp. SIO2C9]|uniref:M48 family metalloprotease n=1 Tax=Okeania sp. SIO2C9 TaxID=2607791 RepID=UPI0013BF30DB|nr:M48 family metalloprotease [Okeania sp. SIO2C9]NEQ74621.1 M48 family metalloprotease [Okeania sp. SIO2C9]
MIDNTSSAIGDFVPEKPSLKAGLLALKQKNYPQAIAHLEIISQQESLKQKLKAKMGLIVAYEQTKQIDKAITLCRNLTKISNDEIQTFAHSHLKELLKQYPQKNPKKSTIPTPKPPPLPPPHQQQKIQTGFVPFNPTSDRDESAKNNQKQSQKNINLSNINNSVKKSSQPSDFVEHPQSNQNYIDTEKNQTQPLSTEINNSNPKPLNKPHKKSTDVAKDTGDRSSKIIWREAERAKGGSYLKSPNLTIFWLEKIAVLAGLFWLSLTILKLSLDLTNDFLVWLPYFRPIQIFYRDPTRNFIIFITVLFVFSPWLIDGLLILGYGIQNLPTTTLINYSKEANKLLRSFCQKRKIRGIKLKILPIDVPIAFSYGCLPRFFKFRIVVSQGLLDKLAADEIATIYAREISHFKTGAFWLMSMATLTLQIPYTIYWQLTFWADWLLDFVDHRLPDFLPEFIKSCLPILVSGFRVFAAIISTLSYGLYWLLKLPTLWLSRRSAYHSDRLACNLTGNPNGLTRAILKITIGMANDIQNQGKIRNLLESFELLMPVGINQAITVGSICSHHNFASIFNWDITNPYRHWLAINDSHPLLGERLKILELYANFWKLETEINLENINANAIEKNQLSKNQKEKYLTPPTFDLQKLLLQGAPFFGMLIGLFFAGLFWLIGGISSAVGLWRLDWLLGDISILVGSLAIGFSIGIFIRINYFFPDIKPAKILQNPNWLELLTDLEALPLDSQPIQLKGQLLGKSGISNFLGQDLILQTTQGLIKLHYSSQLGPIGNFWPAITNPGDLVGKSITVTGWWRRGAIPWIDIHNLKGDSGKSLNNGHPVWSTIVACIFSIWGVYMIYVGRF